jgi:hypothetical protein
LFYYIPHNKKIKIFFLLLLKGFKEKIDFSFQVVKEIIDNGRTSNQATTDGEGGKE